MLCMQVILTISSSRRLLSLSDEVSKSINNICAINTSSIYPYIHNLHSLFVETLNIFFVFCITVPINKEYSQYLLYIRTLESLPKVVFSQKENTLALQRCGYTHNLTSKGYIPTFKSLLHCITYLINKLNK